MQDSVQLCLHFALCRENGNQLGLDKKETLIEKQTDLQQQTN